MDATGIIYGAIAAFVMMLVIAWQEGDKDE